MVFRNPQEPAIPFQLWLENCSVIPAKIHGCALSPVLWGHDYQAAVTDDDVSSASDPEDTMRAAHIYMLIRIIWF